VVGVGSGGRGLVLKVAGDAVDSYWLARNCRLDRRSEPGTIEVRALDSVQAFDAGRSDLEPIKIIGLDVNDKWQLVAHLSGMPSDEWETYFREYWNEPESYGMLFDKRRYAGVQNAALIFNDVKVEDFNANLKEVAVAGVQRANERVAVSAQARLAKVEAEKEAAAKRAEALEEERRKAQETRFD
jgi:hypothetical protein